MTTCLIDMFVVIRLHSIRAQNHRSAVQQQQMFLLTLGSIFIFILITLPNGIYIILSARAVLPNVTFYILELRSLLAFIQSLNYSSHFYIHSLTSSLFREEYRKRLWRRGVIVTPAITFGPTQTNTLPMTLLKTKPTTNKSKI